MSESDSIHWTETLHTMLDSGSDSGDSIIKFIEDKVPNEESRLYDDKRQIFIHNDNTDIGKERQFKLLKHVSALANTRTEQRYRYLFICFTDDRKFIGSDDWESKGGNHIADVDESALFRRSKLAS
ncbi:hypothetical protein [Natronobiforma cellulositropha]